MDVLEDVLVGAKVGVPVVDTSADARVGLHSSCSLCGNLHDMVDPELIRLIFEDIKNFLGVCHGDGDWFPSLLRLGGLGPLVLAFLCVDGERLSVIGFDCGGLICGGGKDSGWWDGCRECDCCDKRREAGVVNFRVHAIGLGVARYWRRVEQSLAFCRSFLSFHVGVDLLNQSDFGSSDKLFLCVG